MRALRWSLLLVPFLAPPAMAAPPEVSLKDDAVVITGVTPGGRVALFGIVRRSLEYLERVERQDAILFDEDGDGEVKLDLEEPLTPRALWFAVDLTGGEFKAAGSETSEMRQVPPPDDALSAARDDLQDHHDFVELFLARPGTDGGAWGFSGGDGGESDADGLQDRAVKAPFSSLYPIANSPKPPDQVAPRDVLVMVNPDDLEFYVVQLGGN